MPALLDDEADGLVRDWGLVFLPGGRILRFDREAHVDLDRLVEVRPRPHRAWRPLPVPRPLADRIVEIGREEPEVPPGELYRELEEEMQAGLAGSKKPGRGKGGPNEPPTERPAGAQGDAADVESTGGLPSGLQEATASLRRLIGRAARASRRFARRSSGIGLTTPPWSGSSCMSSAKAIRRVALRHAFPMAPADPRHRQVEWGNRLPWSRAVYNLMDLIGGPNADRPWGPGVLDPTW